MVLSSSSQTLTHQEGVKKILQNHYSYGYRIESSIEMRRFRKFAEFDGVSVPKSDDQLRIEILQAGIVFDDKVYIISSKTISDLKKIFEDLDKDGVTIIFYEALMDFYRECMEDNHITSSGMLKEILYRNQGDVFSCSQNIYFAKNFISTNNKCTENEAVTNEICRVWEDSSVASIEKLVDSLFCIPENYIKRYISGNRRFVWVSEGAYMLIDHFVITVEEEKAIHDFVTTQCLLNGFASINDVPLGNIAENNYDLSASGLHAAIYNKVLFDDFYINGKILTREQSGLDVVTLVKQHIANRNECTFQEANDKVTELTGSKYRYMAYSALYDSMVRIDMNRYVADRLVQFDIDAIDIILSSFIPDGFISIKEVTTFALFPMCGQAWNHYLLESFCYKYSRKYSLRLIGFNDRNAGIIAERDLTLSYEDLLARAAARAKIKLDSETIGKFFFDAGYMGKRKFAWLDTITEQAIAIREEL